LSAETESARIEPTIPLNINEIRKKHGSGISPGDAGGFQHTEFRVRILHPDFLKNDNISDDYDLGTPIAIPL
jgi:hypothetical protein